MPSNYPNALDNLNDATRPTLTHREVTEAIEAIQAALGARLVNTRVVGEIVPFAGSTAPNGWMLCDGTAISRTTYSALFAVTSTNYGSGNGSTTYNLPNLKGSVPVGRDAAQVEFDVLGETGGAKTVTLTAAQSGLPNHTHSLPMAMSGAPFGTLDVPLRSSGGGDGGFRTGAAVNATSGAYNSGTANEMNASQSHQNMPPYQVVNYIIYTGVFT